MSTHARRVDPRWYQIAVLGTLLAYGVLCLEFDVSLARCGLTIVVALLTQALFTRLMSTDAFEPKSALISSLSLCLLLRSNDLSLAAVAAFLAIAMKFLLRVNGKHLFNPTNGAIIALLALGAPVWVSPGQWGNVAFFAFAVACLGTLVLNRAARSDVTYAFMLFYGGLVFGRSLFLGEPLAIPLHHLESGALLLFTFFMISDPKTTPDTRAGRVLFAALVALGGYASSFSYFRTNGLLWSLAGFSLLVPLIDRLSPGRRYGWSAPSSSPLRPLA
jgi:enediyne biosynthesis protein E5